MALFFKLYNSAQRNYEKMGTSSSNKQLFRFKRWFGIKHLNRHKPKGDYLVQIILFFLFENGSDSPINDCIIETKTDSTLH